MNIEALSLRTQQWCAVVRLGATATFFAIGEQQKEHKMHHFGWGRKYYKTFYESDPRRWRGRDRARTREVIQWNLKAVRELGLRGRLTFKLITKKRGVKVRIKWWVSFKDVLRMDSPWYSRRVPRAEISQREIQISEAQFYMWCTHFHSFIFERSRDWISVLLRQMLEYAVTNPLFLPTLSFHTSQQWTQWNRGLRWEAYSRCTGQFSEHLWVRRFSAVFTTA
jgi:hypothetical protein